jgi:hypothetical protein
MYQGNEKFSYKANSFGIGVDWLTMSTQAGNNQIHSNISQQKYRIKATFSNPFDIPFPHISIIFEVAMSDSQ